MTKLEELTALLVNEINDFKHGIEKLDKINSKLNDTKIKMDLTEYKTIIETHQRQMKSHLNSLERFQNHFDTRVKQAKIYPNWAVVVFIGSMIMSIGSVVFLVISYFG